MEDIDMTTISYRYDVNRLNDSTYADVMQSIVCL